MKRLSIITLMLLLFTQVVSATPPGGTNYLAPLGQFNGAFDLNLTLTNCFRGSNTDCGTAFDHGPGYCTPCATVSDGATSRHSTSLGGDYDTNEATGIIIENDDPVFLSGYIGNDTAQGCANAAGEANSTDQWSSTVYVRENSSLASNNGNTLLAHFKINANLSQGSNVCVGIVTVDSTFAAHSLYDNVGFTPGQDVSLQVPLVPNAAAIEIGIARTGTRTAGNTSPIGLTLFDWEICQSPCGSAPSNPPVNPYSSFAGGDLVQWAYNAWPSLLIAGIASMIILIFYMKGRES